MRSQFFPEFAEGRVSLRTSRELITLTFRRSFPRRELIAPVNSTWYKWRRVAYAHHSAFIEQVDRSFRPPLMIETQQRELQIEVLRIDEQNTIRESCNCELSKKTHLLKFYALKLFVIVINASNTSARSHA